MPGCKVSQHGLKLMNFRQLSALKVSNNKQPSADKALESFFFGLTTI